MLGLRRMVKGVLVSLSVNTFYNKTSSIYSKHEYLWKNQFQGLVGGDANAGPVSVARS